VRFGHSCEASDELFDGDEMRETGDVFEAAAGRR
jgi:hypothetical protein